MKGRPRGRLGLPLPYTTVLLLLGWHDVCLEEQQHAMVQLAELNSAARFCLPLRPLTLREKSCREGVLGGLIGLAWGWGHQLQYRIAAQHTCCMAPIAIIIYLCQQASW